VDSQNLAQVIQGVEELQRYLAQGRRMASALLELSPAKLEAAGLTKTRMALADAHNSMFMIVDRLVSPEDFPHL
jgi:hypothetical protein